MISQAAIQKILGIKDKIPLQPEEMADKLNVSFYPHTNSASENVINFSNKLKDCFLRLKVNIVPSDQIWEIVPIRKRLVRFIKYSLNDVVWWWRKILGLPEVNFYIDLGSIFRLSGRKRIKKGICLICLGEQEMSMLPMQYISNFKDNTILTIVDFPAEVDELSDFRKHFDTAMSLFAYHMTNIVIAVDGGKFMLYNFNASHPIYQLNDGLFDNHILHALIPKLVAPINPHKFKEFKISDKTFSIEDKQHRGVVEELAKGAKLFDKTGLYPSGKKIDELPFRHNFHRLIGKLHLDNRNGMSFGFFAHQMPTVVPKLIPYTSFKRQGYRNAFADDDYFVDLKNGQVFLMIEVKSKKYVLPVPPVWVMSLRSGSDKVNFNPKKDLLKMGLINGELWMEFPEGLTISYDYKPSFDTKVILAHALGNVIIASIAREIDAQHPFYKSIENHGCSLCHWHGYFNKQYIPTGVSFYGTGNPHVSCSSPQSAVYALDGKLSAFCDKIDTEGFGIHRGDVHVEPHHGTNVCFPSLVELANLLLQNPDASVLGNKYL